MSEANKVFPEARESEIAFHPQPRGGDVTAETHITFLSRMTNSGHVDDAPQRSSGSLSFLLPTDHFELAQELARKALLL